MTNDEQFFYDNAGFSWNKEKETEYEGHVRCAISLAEAEKVAKEVGITFEWDVDGDINSSEWRDDVEPYATWNCVAQGPDGEVFTSLCGIDFGPEGSPSGFNSANDYGRVVEAELALEYEPPSELSKRIRAEFGNKLVVDMTEADVERYKQIRAEIVG